MSSVGMDCLNNSVLEQFLGAAGVEELRSKIVDTIVEEVRNQIKDSYDYIISPDDIAAELQNMIIKDIYNKVKEEYEQKIKDSFEKRLNMVL